MKLNQKKLFFVIILLITTFFLLLIDTPVDSLINAFQCSQEANNLVDTQQQSANKEAAMKASTTDMKNMKKEVAVILDKSIFSHKLHTCIAQIHVMINNGTNTLNEEQIFATNSNATQNRIVAQYSPSDNGSTNFIISIQTGKYKSHSTQSDMVIFERTIGLE